MSSSVNLVSLGPSSQFIDNPDAKNKKIMDFLFRKISEVFNKVFSSLKCTEELKKE
ncbi:hypothetical protein RHABOEDO_000673 [Candidatus Rhabdochlamydia oedothoracis]|uniref:Uncharacterized protein n=1 Tax=Candidatus Rhabdochlamydia oedothoracis TaxID=2720720 RepID=A0ABX8V4V8_9BACT|nr:MULTISPECIES: hypothetical protein [Rhabdochlamydia]KAG6558571.1 hypothetical protein RHOW815_001441 [Candidatus Rhabdochlamydia sp. W815]QYF48500.1 hypothetical protein RHABOEDO_000673 [Candidatus Rhabdochlamydia oedothoracis]